MIAPPPVTPGHNQQCDCPECHYRKKHPQLINQPPAPPEVPFPVEPPKPTFPAVPAWLDEVLAAGAVLDLHHADARAKLAAAIMSRAGAGDREQNARVVAETIAESARAVFAQKIATTTNGRQFLVDAEYAPRLARELGNNSAQAALFVLELDEEAA